MASDCSTAGSAARIAAVPPALIENLGGVELLIVLLVALLVFGKRLPEVAAQAGRQIAKVRHGLDSAWRDTGMEKELRDMKRGLESAIPRDLSIGDMARIASAEMDKRVRANEEAAREGSRSQAGPGKLEAGETAPEHPGAEQTGAASPTLPGESSTKGGDI